MHKKFGLFLLLVCLAIPAAVAAGNIADYLILQDIGSYRIDKPEKSLPGEPPSGGPRTYEGPAIVGGADHFPDHTDTTYEVMYLGGVGKASPTVKVTQHAGSEADKWLLHEFEKHLRSSNINKLGRRSESAGYLKLLNTEMFITRIAGGKYAWISNTVTVVIEYYDSDFSKPEPLEIVQAYLTKYPPTFPANYKIFNTPGNDLKWIREEFGRRLWLADRWASLIQPGDAELNEKLANMVDSLEVFLNYRAKYFSIEARDEIDNLKTLARQGNETALRTKLAEYKEWWAAHKSESISLP